MGKFKLADFGRNMMMSAEKHSPEILMGLGIGGMFTTVILAVKATPKAIKLLEEKKKECGVEKLTKIDTIKTTWKCYIPSATVAIVSTGCLIGSSRVSLRRNAALATAYKLVETAHQEYREKVIETIGEKQEEAIREKVAQEKVNNNPVSSREVILTGNGDDLYYDTLSGRYFRSDEVTVGRAINTINNRILNENYVSLNDFYDELGLEPTKIGDDLGWNIDTGYAKWSPRAIVTDKGKPCIVIDFDVPPVYKYYKLG